MSSPPTPPNYEARLRDRLLGWTDNETYGHAAIIRAYTGRRTRIIGHLQHGWNPGTGWTLLGRELIHRRSVRHVWGERQKEASKRVGIRVRSVVGAPWLYGPWSGQLQRSVNGPSILFPMHGTGAHPVEYSHVQLAKEFRSSSAGELLVCLHRNEFAQPQILQIYQELELPVTTMGDPFAPDYLHRLAQLLCSASGIATNRVATVAFYAGSLGLPVQMLGASAHLTGETPEATTTLEAIHTEIALHGTEIPWIRDMAMRELGAEFKRHPEELAEQLGMSGGFRAAYVPRLLASHLGRAVRRLGG